MKVISKSSIAQKPENQARFIQESAILRLMNYPNIIRYHDFIENEDVYGLVLDYIEEGSLFNKLKQLGYFNEVRALLIFRQIVLAVEYLHFHGICHRDLKLENVLIDQHDNIYLTDFGFARWIESNIPDTTCGSPHYAAPELIAGQTHGNFETDIWSIGVILFVMLSVCIK